MTKSGSQAFGQELWALYWQAAFLVWMVILEIKNSIDIHNYVMLSISAVNSMHQKHTSGPLVGKVKFLSFADSLFPSAK